VSAANQSACAATKAGETPSSSIRAGESCATCRQRCLTLVLHSKLVWYGGWVPISSPPILLVLHSQPPAFACPLSPGQGPMGYDVAMPHPPCSSPFQCSLCSPYLACSSYCSLPLVPLLLIAPPGRARLRRLLAASGGSSHLCCCLLPTETCSLLRPT
jgi:hypothetical protein